MTRVLAAVLLLLSPPAQAQHELAGTSLRIQPVTTLPHNLSGRQGFWAKSTGPTANHTLLRKADGTDLDLDLGGAFCALAGCTMTGSNPFISANSSGAFVLSNLGGGNLSISTSGGDLEIGGAGGGGTTIGASSTFVKFPSLTIGRSSGAQITLPNTTGTFATTNEQLVADSSIPQYALVKISTSTAHRVTLLLTSDAATDVEGIAQAAAGGAGTTIAVQTGFGQESLVISDGTGSIALGDWITRSSTVSGDVMGGTSSNGICRATSTAAATPGTTFYCR